MLGSMASLLEASESQEHVFTPQEASNKYACCRDLLDGWYTETNGAYEGWVLVHDAKPRTAMVAPRGGSPAKRSAHGVVKVETLVLDVMLVDSTGPVLLTVWSEHATAFLEAKDKLRHASAVAKIIVKIQGFRVTTMAQSEWNGRVVTTIKTLHTKD